ncbi:MULTISPECIES: hypothetical protein [unclassified Sphingomonas]|uniref:hypothetical protein n=1 Tax=unclassified Sphingomonas TaxID=196159 RepID=UPI0006F716BD|nr:MULTISPECIES: hypothetical protein [unclassified Sphingomonas]KQS51429.1 hypothetical protein ASG20_05225 [Sphingomonas sp. Leaf198]
MSNSRLSSIWLIGVAIPAGLLLAPSIKADPQIESRSGPVLTLDGHRFRDLDRNGRLDAYEDWRLSPERRTDDLLGRMTLTEKAGTMLHVALPTIGGTFERYDLARINTMVRLHGITSFGSRTALSPRRFAEQNAALQAIGETSRLGIPITITTDPDKEMRVAPRAQTNGRGRISDGDTPAPIIAAGRAGRVAEARIDASVRPIMIAKFVSGLFENPYVARGAAQATRCRSNCGT